MTAAQHIMIVEDDAILREQLRYSLQTGYELAEANSPQSALTALEQFPADLVLLDLQLTPGGTTEDGFSVLRELRRRSADAIVIVMTGNRGQETRMRAIEEGAYDCFMKPFDVRELRFIIQRSLERLDLERENRRLKREVLTQFSFQNLIGCSPPMMQVFDTIRRIADSRATVLLLGESGTGKEVVARAIHFQSSRRDAPFVPVHCSALPESLIESELFGHEKGAFTGAVSTAVGRFEMANHGTLFLDEIGTLNLNVQTKLLRVLEEQKFERLGGQKTLQVDIRLIAATNEDLESLVAQGRFRADLFFRLNVLPVKLPPLRDRREDIPLLVDHLIRLYCQQANIAVKKIHGEALDKLMAYEWKGNVRELQNVIQRAVLMTDADTIRVEQLPPHVAGTLSLAPKELSGLPAEGLNLVDELARYERELLSAALKQSGGVKSKAASLLKVTNEQMKYLCRKYDLGGNFSPPS